MTRPPLREVALLAEVSQPTVSRVLNGRPGVAAATRDRVLRAITELGYDQSIAQTRPKTGVVGVITPELTNPVFAALLHIVEGRLARYGYLAQVGVATAETATETRHVKNMVGQQFEGIVFIAGQNTDTNVGLESYADLYLKSIPIVLINGRDTGLDVPHLYTDERQAAAQGVSHLLDLGHERIGLVVGPRNFVPTQRIIDGYRSTMDQHGQSATDELVVETLFTVEGGQSAAVELLESGVTAILAGSDLMALGVIGSARRLGLDVPGDVSVVGYDGTAITAFLDPPLTTLRQPVLALGELAADAMASEIDGTRRHRGVFTFTAELVARASTARAPERNSA